MGKSQGQVKENHSHHEFLNDAWIEEKHSENEQWTNVLLRLLGWFPAKKNTLFLKGMWNEHVSVAVALIVLEFFMLSNWCPAEKQKK